MVTIDITKTLGKLLEQKGYAGKDLSELIAEEKRLEKALEEE